MTPADLARQNAISFECKKDSLRQMQNGDWKVAFTVQGLDMDERITRAAMGTRFVAVLVEVNDDELPVQRQKEVMPNSELSARTTPGPDNAKPLPAPKSARAMDWRELQPAAQAGIRCSDPVFWKFLQEEHALQSVSSDSCAEHVRALCGVSSRSELCTNHKARVLWHQIDVAFQAWKFI